MFYKARLVPTALVVFFGLNVILATVGNGQGCVRWYC
jgi:hypothetical protein